MNIENLKITTEQEISNAQVNPSTNLGKLPLNKSIMEKARTDGTPVVIENKPTEQVNAQIQTADGEVVQQDVSDTSNMSEKETSGTPATPVIMPTEQVNAQIQTADGEVVQQTSTDDVNGASFVATLLALLGDNLPKKAKYSVTYNVVKKAGLKVVFFNFNRKVCSSHINTLWKSAKDKKVFAEGCYVVPLRPILEKFPDIEVYDLEGNQVTLDSPDVDMCLAVYDGQHRITVCELHPEEIDVWLDINDFDGTNPLEKIKIMNSFSKNWSGTDLRVSNIGAGLSANKLYEESENLQDLYGITPKLAEYVLTFKREATTKKDLVSGKDTTVYVDEHGNRGLGIFNAAMTNFKGAKEVKKIEFTDAVVYAYESTKDSEKAGFARNMKLYLGTLPETDCDEIRRLISDKDFGKLKTFASKGYKAFCGAGHTEEALAQMEANVDKNIDAYVKALQKTNQDKASKKPLKSGRVHEVIQHNRDAETLVAAEKLAKAKAEKSTKKAQEDQTLVDDLKSTGREGA